MENEPAQTPHPETRQQRMETFTDAFVQLAAVSSRPLRQLIDEAVADVPHLWRLRRDRLISPRSTGDPGGGIGMGPGQWHTCT